MLIPNGPSDIRRTNQKEDILRAAKNAYTAADKNVAKNVVKSDAVQISTHAQMLAKLRGLPELDQKKVDDLKKELENGMLVTDDAVTSAVEKLIRDILPPNSNKDE